MKKLDNIRSSKNLKLKHDLDTLEVFLIKYWFDSIHSSLSFFLIFIETAAFETKIRTCMILRFFRCFYSRNFHFLTKQLWEQSVNISLTDVKLTMIFSKILSLEYLNVRCLNWAVFVYHRTTRFRYTSWFISLSRKLDLYFLMNPLFKCSISQYNTALKKVQISSLCIMRI